MEDCDLDVDFDDRNSNSDRKVITRPYVYM